MPCCDEYSPGLSVELWGYRSKAALGEYFCLDRYLMNRMMVYNA
jgi:hypothetical protein